MTELPPAIVEPKRGMQPATAALLRRIVGVAILVGASLWCWRTVKAYLRSDTSKALEVRQDKARAKIGTGFDTLFARMLDKDTTSIDLVANLSVAHDLGSGYDAVDCGWGLDAAFAEALGPDVLHASTNSFDPDAHTRLQITGTITPNGTSFQLPHAKAAYPGITLAADVRFLGKTLHVETQPAGAIEFKHMRFGFSFEGMSASDVAGGILQGACKEVGYAILEQHTSWRRPPLPARPDPLVECEQGFHCRENAEALEATEPAKAATLYDTACQHDDEDACVRLGAMASTFDKNDNRTKAAFTLEMACHREQPRTCEALGRLLAANGSSELGRHDALLAYLRACDLGVATACAAAAPLLAHTPFADAAAVLTTGKPVVSKTFGTVFALRWGQWSKWDRGQPTAWVTKEPAHLPAGAIVTPFAAGTQPRGIAPPPNVATIYAVALEAGFKPEDRCDRCNPSGVISSMTQMRALDCVCALAPP